MAKLNYAAHRGIRNKEVGCFYSNMSKKWVVRMKNKSGQTSTLAQFDDEEQAKEFYNKKIGIKDQSTNQQ